MQSMPMRILDLLYQLCARFFLASVITYGVERPAMSYIRERYNRGDKYS